MFSGRLALFFDFHARKLLRLVRVAVETVRKDQQRRGPQTHKDAKTLRMRLLIRRVAVLDPPDPDGEKDGEDTGLKTDRAERAANGGVHDKRVCHDIPTAGKQRCARPQAKHTKSQGLPLASLLPFGSRRGEPIDATAASAKGIAHAATAAGAAEATALTILTTTLT